MEINYPIPEWLNKEFLIKVIMANNPIPQEDIEITKFEVDYATNKGDNFSSEMYRIIYSGQMKEKKVNDLRIIVKCRFDNPKLLGIFEPYGFYKKEIDMYSIYISEFEKILIEVGISVKLTPKCLYFDREQDIFVMEDESTNGYRNGNKQDRICLNTVRMTLRKLAYFHAASAVYNQRNKNCFSLKTSATFDPKIDGLKETIENIFKAFLSQVSSWEGYEYYLRKLEALQSNYRALAHQTMTPVDGFNCLIHGDLWLNNILVKYLNNNDSFPLDILLIDLQIYAWASPTIDLHYFFYTSLNEEDYQNRLDELIQFYHGVLSNTLEKLDYRFIPSLHQLQIDYASKCFHGVFGGLLFKPMAYMQDNSKARDTKELQNIQIKNDRIQSEQKYLLKFLDQKGVLDLVLNK